MPSEFVLAIQEYFGFQFFSFVWLSKYFLACQFPFLAGHLALGTLLFHAQVLFSLTPQLIRPVCAVPKGVVLGQIWSGKGYKFCFQRSLRKGLVLAKTLLTAVDHHFAEFRTKDEQNTGFVASTVFLMVCSKSFVFSWIRSRVSISAVCNQVK